MCSRKKIKNFCFIILFTRTNEPTKLVRHSQISDDDVALDTIQSKVGNILLKEY